jgi:hypothetical protein
MAVSKYASVEQRRAQYRAWHAVKYALTTGKLVRPAKCSHCGKWPGKNKRGRSKIEAHHHKGYDRAHQLDVVWLCSRCHRNAEDLRPLNPNSTAGGLVQRLKTLRDQRQQATQGV